MIESSIHKNLYWRQLPTSWPPL